MIIIRPPIIIAVQEIWLKKGYLAAFSGPVQLLVFWWQTVFKNASMSIFYIFWTESFKALWDSLN